VATAKPQNYSLECFIRDMKPIMDTVKDRPIADRVESLLEHLMEDASFLEDTDSEKLGESGFSHIEYVRHIMKTGQSCAPIIASVEPLLRAIRKRRYIGTSRFCPVCESRLGEFVPCGDRLKPNRRCPVCGSLERHRLVWLFMHQITNLFTAPRKKFLHIAPEPCLASVLQESENIDYVSTDLTRYAMTQADLTQLCFPNEIFDAVYASHVLEHVLDDRGAMREIYRTLKPGGWAILQVPISKGKVTYEDATIVDPDKRNQAFGERDHVRVYGEDYYDRLTEAGFTVHTEKLLLQTIRSAVQRFGLDPGEQISFCIRTPYESSQ
jgi:SAM-dependent methyltransferase